MMNLNRIYTMARKPVNTAQFSIRYPDVSDKELRETIRSVVEEMLDEKKRRRE